MEKRWQINGDGSCWPARSCCPGPSWAASSCMAGFGVQRPGGNPMNDSRFTVDHVRLATDKPFEEVAKAFERQLGQFDAGRVQGGCRKRGRRGGQGQDRSDGGAERLHAVRHAATTGRCCASPARSGRRSSTSSAIPLFALQMTQHDIRASLYAPLRVLIYENEEGKTCVEYDRPSSLVRPVRQCRDHRRRRHARRKAGGAGRNGNRITLKRGTSCRGEIRSLTPKGTTTPSPSQT